MKFKMAATSKKQIRIWCEWARLKATVTGFKMIFKRSKRKRYTG